MTIDKKTLKSEYPLIAELWHPVLNGVLTPADVPPHSNKKVWWGCSEGHAYQRTVDKQVTRANIVCPVCNGKLYVAGVNDVKSKFPEVADEWNYEINGGKRPEQFSFISSERVGWKCKECGTEWVTRIKNRCLKGHGCPQCASKKRWKKRYSNMTSGITEPSLLEEWDYELNEKGPECYTPKSNATVFWHCKKCGYRYPAKISNKANGRKCACCQRKVVVPGKNDLATTHPNLAKEWDYERNENLTPQMVLYGTRKKVYWKCPAGHSYLAAINHRTSYGHETNCPICSSGRQTSFAEQAVYFYVKKYFPDAINRYRDIFNNGMELDIFIPSIRIAIEYDGEAWHKKDKREREKKKWEVCRKNNIHLIRLVEKMCPGEWIQADEGFSIEDGPMYEPEQLEKVIWFLLDKLQFYLQTKKLFDINIKRDEPTIRKYMTIIKGSLKEKFPSIANEWNYELNGYLTPDKVKPGSDIIAWWTCPVCGNIYQATIGHRTAKKPTGCPKCGIKKNALAKARAVEMIDLETGQVIQEFVSLSEASRKMNISQGNIGSVCRGGSGRTQAGGYGWRYKNNTDDSQIN